MTAKNKLDPSTVSFAYEAMAPEWKLVETLLGGTMAMREAGQDYLPKHEAETDYIYQTRLNSNVLLNMFERVRDTLAGRPFSDTIQLKDMPDIMESEIFPNIDMQGSSLNIFLRMWFREGLAKGLVHVLVDFPRLEEPDLPRTLETDRQERRRPYWVLIRPEQLLAAHAEIIDGVEVLTHVRILECYVERDGFAEIEKERIRILEPGIVQIWEKVKQKNGKEEWGMVEEYSTGINFIPLVTFYADRISFMRSRLPLLNLAHLNVTHWQSNSDQRNILTVTRFPILALSGTSEDETAPMTIGPNKVHYIPDPQGRLYYVEPQGAAIRAGQEDLDTLEEQMSQYGAEFLKKRTGDITATARAIDSSEASSDLAAIVGVFEDVVEKAFGLTALWLGIIDFKGTIKLKKEYELNEENLQDLQILRDVRAARDISRETLLKVLKQRRILPDDFSGDEDKQELQEEADNIFGASEIDIVE